MGVDVFVVRCLLDLYLGSIPFPDVDLAQWPQLNPVSWPAAPVEQRGDDHERSTSTRNVTVFGAPEHGPGMPRVSEGRSPSKPDEVAASSTMGREALVTLSGRRAGVRVRWRCAEFHRAGQDPNVLTSRPRLTEISISDVDIIHRDHRYAPDSCRRVTRLSIRVGAISVIWCAH